ncbi:uncharacterized protein LOC130985722 [Salvia miltiorrhiza]|uniref:uncharacterized protein LOC130985722 n=1 Tax=Salvia miltiorrhiza TaxID=226208 RepID=UPI0025AC2F65|nr:uncharacterized protein LOC130985722 [Salvia miltiorrhiza]XP_057764797.1 uncharacterized protein LOC130985722 [Salvia miltiorrhiza]XP_057764798.1 uncharacterized protein LOC130985722 [Salvia miltiorrhiza]XP_057764799.1 uncharacterized protein LOC130985722 [Salvia miltiorrhiza]
MPAVWFALRRSMKCRSQQAEVHDPDGGSKSLSNISTKKTSGGGRSGCSRSIANLKDVINGSKRHTEKPPICSPRSIGSSELLNPMTHEVILDSETCELKISGASDLAGQRPVALGSPVMRSSSSLSRRVSVSSTRPRSSLGGVSNGALFCPKCGDHFVRWEAVEAHHLSKHAVTELGQGDSSRRIVEMICRARGDSARSGIERILKVHNMHKTLAQFEEYREVVKIRASKLAKKHPRCLADGNELLRFHGATVECSLGMKGSSGLCASEKCRVCRILRDGFVTKQEGVFTASTSSRAIEMVDGDSSLRKALIVCRVIAGRVHRPLENMEEMVGQSGFDSVAGKVGAHSTIEELYLLSARALLPCFVVIYKC